MKKKQGYYLSSGNLTRTTHKGRLMKFQEKRTSMLGQTKKLPQYVKPRASRIVKRMQVIHLLQPPGLRRKLMSRFLWHCFPGERFSVFEKSTLTDLLVTALEEECTVSSIHFEKMPRELDREGLAACLVKRYLKHREDLSG